MLLQNALDKKHYEVFKYSRSKSYFSFIKICIDKKVEITSVNNLIDEIYEFGITLCNNCNDDNVLEFITIAQDIGEFLKEIKSPKAFDFDKRLKELNNLKDKYIIKHGIHHKQEVPIDEFVNYFNDDKIPWDVRFLSLTHQRIGLDRWISYYSYSIKNGSESVWDKFASTTNKVDDFFTMSRQMDVSVKDQLFAMILARVFINKEKIKTFKDQLFSLITSVYENFKVDYDVSKLNTNLETMKEMFINVIDNVKNLELLCGLNYGLTMFLLGLIEEFLSNIFRSLNKEIKYIDDEHLTLYILLNDKEMGKLFDEEDLKFIQYFLLGKNGVGNGYRNKFAHFKTLDLKEINDFTVLKILHTYVYMVNCCFTKIIHDTRGKKD